MPRVGARVGAPKEGCAYLYYRRFHPTDHLTRSTSVPKHRTSPPSTLSTGPSLSRGLTRQCSGPAASRRPLTAIR
jgi:hypothetical protein